MRREIFYSFVLPAYKALYFREAIEGVLHQTYTNFELIIVDDCSPDNLEKIVAEYTDERIRYYKNEVNIGGKDLVAQWNHCLEYANGDFVILASDDDIYDKEYLSCVDNIIKQYPEVCVFRPLIEIENISGLILSERTRLKGKVTYQEYLSEFLEGNIFSGIPQFVFRLKPLLSMGGFVNFPTAWFSDDATVAALSTNGIVIIDRCLFRFRSSGQNISSALNSLDMIKKKSDAAVRFIEYMSAILQKNCETDEEFQNVLSNLVLRTRRVTMFALKNSTRKVYIKGLFYIHRLRSEVFPVKWQIRRFIAYSLSFLRRN